MTMSMKNEIFLRKQKTVLINIKFPLANALLISLNLIVFFGVKYFIASPEMIYTEFGFSPAFFTQQFLSQPFHPAAYLPLFTSLFLHAGWGHLIFNLLYLFVFGREIERKMGALKFIVFYFLCGIIANLGQYAFSFKSHALIIGSSGAISGILAGYLFIFPWITRSISLGFPLLHFPAVIYVFFWFCFQAINAFWAIFNGAGSVAWMSHVSGFLSGMVFYSFFISKRKGKKIHYI